MSRSSRDQRQRPHSGKRCPEARNGGCVACRTGEFKRIDNRRDRAAARRAARAARRDEEKRYD